MSGAIGLNLIPVSNNVQPSEGSKSAQFNVLWSLTKPVGTVQFNFLQQYQSGQFTTVQAVYIDNSTVPYAVNLVCNQTGHVIIVRAFSQGMFPVVASTSPSFTATLEMFTDQTTGIVLDNCTTRFFFLNSPQVPYTTDVSQLENIALTAVPPEFAPSGIVFQILPPAGPNVHYVINFFSTSVTLTGDAPASLTIQLGEMGNTVSGNPPGSTFATRVLIAQNVLTDGIGSGTLMTTFPEGLLCFIANNGLGLLVDGIPTGAGAVVSFTLAYSLVTIQ
jgi:hypothetical protein